MSALTPIAEKLGKLIRMLSSSHDGEVIAAALAIRRALKDAGLDVHALADGLTASGTNGKKFSEQEAVEIYQRGLADGRRAVEEERPVKFDDVESPSWHAIAVECAAHKARLFPQEIDFVNDMIRWTVHGNPPSEKQGAWLRKIYVRIGKKP
jgi:hypothetical protein